METLTCEAPHIIKKELWTYLLACNLLRILMMHPAQAAYSVLRTLSFRHTIELWLTWMRYSSCCGGRERSCGLGCREHPDLDPGMLPAG